MRYLEKYFNVDTKKYARACEKTRAHFGAFEKMANVFYKETGEQMTGNNIRRWFHLQIIPFEYMVLIQKLSGEKIKVSDFIGWAIPYIK